jgi:hypothetical protein
VRYCTRKEVLMGVITLSESWHNIVSDLLWVYRLEGASLKVIQRVHPKCATHCFTGTWAEFSFKDLSVRMLKGEDTEGRVVIVTPVELTLSDRDRLEDELFAAEITRR